MTNADTRIVWIDVETTGLNAAKDKLIQVACIVTDGDLNELDEGFEQKIHYSEEEVSDMRLNLANDYVRNMHDSNGLWSALSKEGAPLQEVEQNLLEYINRHVEKPVTARLGGNSITLDRNFLEANLPSVFNHIHYRSYDMSTLAGWLQLHLQDFQEFEKKGTHDALDDIRESIEEGRYYATLIKRANPPF